MPWSELSLQKRIRPSAAWAEEKRSAAARKAEDVRYILGMAIGKYFLDGVGSNEQ